MTSSTPSRRRRTLVAVAAAASAALIAAGCTSTASAGGSTEPAEIATYAGATTTFGESFTYANGLVVEVKKPVAFVPTSQADGVEAMAGQPVKVRVNIINGSSVEYVPDTLEVTIVSGGKQAEQILDPGARIDLTGPSRPLGRSGVAAFDLAFVVEDPADITLSLVPALGGYDPLVLTTS